MWDRYTTLYWKRETIFCPKSKKKLQNICPHVFKIYIYIFFVLLNSKIVFLYHLLYSADIEEYYHRRHLLSIKPINRINLFIWFTAYISKLVVRIGPQLHSLFFKLSFVNVPLLQNFAADSFSHIASISN